MIKKTLDHHHGAHSIHPKAADFGFVTRPEHFGCTPQKGVIHGC
jgi:hypothetical protein